MMFTKANPKPLLILVQKFNPCLTPLNPQSILS